MKKITMEIKGTIGDEGKKEINTALNDLSGVVAADVVQEEGRAYAYAGDLLQVLSASEAVRDAGYDCHVVNEEYITDVDDYKKSLFPTKMV